MLKKIPFDKLVLLTIPYLLLVSICYNNGYWSVFFLSIFSYYEPQDIVKDIAGPIFRFSGLIAIPMFILITATLSWFRGAEQAKSSEEPKKQEDESKAKKKTGLLLRILKKILLAVLALIGIAALFSIITAIVAALFPYEDESDFIKYYLNSLTPDSIGRVLALLLIPATYGGIILIIVRVLRVNDMLRFTGVVSSFFLSLLIAYHFGRMDGMKVSTGEEFRYWIDTKGRGHKYLGKVNKYYLFSEDYRYINHRGNMNFQIDTMTYQTAVTAITDDSLKAIQLDYYGPRVVHPGKTFVKWFVPRNMNK